jgi:glycosyltransferase involved in cell wall biosynthesis
MEKLSVVIITYNEEAAIERCISSVKKVADEILVVDSNSTDQTKAICLRLGVRFYEHPFEGYIQQKNYSKSLASFDYVLCLDADEALSETLSNSIKKAKLKFDHDGYFMNRMNNYCGVWIRHGNWYPDRKLRLWNRKKGEWGGRNPHDHVNMGADTKVGYLKGDLLHYSYVSIEAHINQFNRFTTTSAHELFSENRKISKAGVLGKGFATFFKGFFLKLGFLDGYYGVALCIINSFATFMKYMKLRELNKTARM